MTRLERRAALLVAAAAAGVAAYGVRLAKKRARYLVEKAAAAFRDDEVPEPETDSGQAPAELGPETDSGQAPAELGPETDSGQALVEAGPETSEN